MTEREFINPDKVSNSRKFRCMGINFFDKFTQLFGGGYSIPGEDLDNIQACLQFVRFKDILDITLAASADAYRKSFKFTSPSEYVDLMLPGICFSVNKAATQEKVDQETVIGCPFQQYLPPNDPDALMKKLNESNMNRANYTRIAELKILIAVEGKNRVELFRRHKRMIVADVQQKFPTQSPVISRSLSGKHWIASWNDERGRKKLTTVPFPSITLPIYGMLKVKITNKRLPASDEEVRQSLSKTMKLIENAVAVP
jgi:hypothetical protein